MRRLRAWYREYYEENPIAWLLVKAELEARFAKVGVPPTAECTSPAQRYTHATSETNNPLANKRFFIWSDEQEFKGALTQPWFLPSLRSMATSETLFLATVIPLLVIVILAYYALAAIRFSALPPRVWVGVLGTLLSSLAMFVPMLGTIEATARVVDVCKPDSGLYVGATRLQGAHVVRGALVFGLTRLARSSAIYGLPVLCAVFIIAHGAPWIGFAAALTVWLYGVVVACCWLVLSVLIAYRAAQGGITAGFVIPMTRLVMALIIVSVGAFAEWIGGLQPLPPYSQWLATPLWWWSLVPPLYVTVSLAVPYSPLWAIAPLSATIGLAWLLSRLVELQAGRFQPQHERVSNAEVEGWE